MDADGLADFWLAAPMRLVHGRDLTSDLLDLTTVVTTLDVGSYYPAMWGSAEDADSDGDSDLFVSTGAELLLYHGPYPAGTYDGSHPSLTIVPDFDEYIAFGTADVADFDADGQAELLFGINGATEFGRGEDVVNIGVLPGDLTGHLDTVDTSPCTAWIRYPEWYRAQPVGDVNGDGYEDLAASRFYEWYVFAGPLSGELTPDEALLEFEAFKPAMNILFLAPGDVDGDGFDEVVALHNGVVEAKDPGDTLPNGAMYVIRGGRSGVVTREDADALWSGTVKDAAHGPRASTGDADGDG